MINKDAWRVRRNIARASWLIIGFGLATIVIATLGFLGVISSAEPYSAPAELLIGGTSVFFFGVLLRWKARQELRLLEMGVNERQLIGQFGSVFLRFVNRRMNPKKKV